jgi:ABC-type dipeptide/oligopeptide/nickel transport system ATPase subunit
LIIPHYEKKPQIPTEVISKLNGYITAGEVTSPKKFIYCAKRKKSLVPVFFSDSRMTSNLKELPIKQTFVDIGEVSLKALKYAFSDKSKVALTNETGHQFFQATAEGLVLSTGLNVILGERSSGKTWTLNTLAKNFDRVKYIRQFSLVEKSDDQEAERFNAVLRQNQSLFIEEYFKEFKGCVESVVDIDLEADDRAVEKYVSDLLQHAHETEKADTYSRTVMFGETDFPEESLSSLKNLIEAAMLLADNTEYRSLIDEFVSQASLKSLAIKLMEQFAKENELRLKKLWVNDLITSIKAELQRKTARTPIPDIDLYRIAMNRQSIKKFSQVTKSIRSENQIFSQDIQIYKIIAERRPFSGAGELKKLSKTQLAFSTAFQKYNDPYQFLKQLKAIAGLPSTDYYKYFVTIKYKILNRFGAEVSGGERSEFRLLQEISDALQFDMLLIDEPESSFDNVFLNSEVNQLIKEISQKMPVVIVTHNSTVGASIKPNFLIFTKRVVTNGTANYETYFGHPSDKELKSLYNGSQPNHKVILNCLEAGIQAYTERKNTYETLSN